MAINSYMYKHTYFASLFKLQKKGNNNNNINNINNDINNNNFYNYGKRFKMLYLFFSTLMFFFCFRVFQRTPKLKLLWNILICGMCNFLFVLLYLIKRKKWEVIICSVVYNYFGKFKWKP